MAERLAIRFGSRNVYDYMKLGEDFEIFEIDAPTSWHGRTILEKQVRSKYGITILATKQGNLVSPSPSPEYVFNGQDTLIVLGTSAQIDKLGK